MDERLLRLYNDELAYIREMGSEFAEQFPKIAGRLGMEGIDVSDPYVERLLEGFAFLTARVQLKLQSEFPSFAQHLLEAVCPQALAQRPSAAIVRFEPDMTEGSLAEGPEAPRHTTLSAQLPPGMQTACTFRTAHPVRIWPLEISAVEYGTRGALIDELPTTKPSRAAVQFRLRTKGGIKLADLPLDELVMHLRGPGGLTGMLYEQLFGHAVEVFVHDARPGGAAHAVTLGPKSIEQVGFDADEGMLPPTLRAYDAFRLLQEYSTLPERFLFARFTGLRRAIEQAKSNDLAITVSLSEARPELERGLGLEHVELFCTPAINLFPRPVDRLQVTDGVTEHLLVPDRGHPLDYELHTLTELSGYGERGEDLKREFHPFYATRDRFTRADARYYTLRRVPRPLSERERLGNRRSKGYMGSDVYVSLVDTVQPPQGSGLRQIGGRALCTNRDLPIHMPLGVGSTDFTCDIGVPVEAIRCLGSPTPPRESPPEGEAWWRLISHLMPNYLSLLDTEKGEGADSLRELMALFADAGDSEVRRRLEGLQQVETTPVIRRIGTGAVAFARGLQVGLTFDENAYEGASVFVMGAVMERVLSRHAPLNSFTETVVKTAQRGEIKRWPARTGSADSL